MSPADVSILVVTYNRAATLRECVDSILMQTVPSKEIIVVDDGSTDDTRELLDSYGDRIQCHYLEHQGQARARNAALSLSRSPWIAFLDSDDYYLSRDVLREFLERFQEDPTLDVVASGWSVVDPEGRPLAEVAPWIQAPVFDLESCLYWKPTLLCAKMFRREIVERVGGFDPTFEACMDTDLILRILLTGGRIGWLRKITYGYRRSADSTMGNAPRELIFLRRAIDNAFSSPSFPEVLRKQEAGIRYSTDVWLAWHLWSRGFSADASAALANARTYHREKPFNQMKKWWGEFGRHSVTYGIRLISEEEFLSITLPYFSTPEDQRPEIRAAFDWWLNVWSFYSAETDFPTATPPALAGKKERELVKLTQRCLSTVRVPAPPETVERFWRDALAQGAVRPAAKGSVVTLYLSGFARAVQGRKVRLAAAWLAKAIAASGSAGAVGPWTRFFRSALAHFLFRKGRDEERAAG
jgi:glycosyltransferase involved in cell wall biosynthesis